MNLPSARRDDLLTTKLDDEVVVYDPERKQAHSLNRVALAVWNHSDGAKTIEELQRAASEEVGVPVDQGAIWVALSKLEKANLLLGKVSTAGAMTRRDMLGKAGRYGAMAVATPLIASALVPMAAAAASACVGTTPPGTAGGHCSSGTATCQCVNRMTPSGPAAPTCVDTVATFGACGFITPGTFTDCTTAGTICIEVDGSAIAGVCFGPCPTTQTCNC
jgi:hypothetical protein